MIELKTRLVNSLLIDHRCLGQPSGLLCAERIVKPRGQGKSADASRIPRMFVFVPPHQRNFRVELVIDARAKIKSPIWQRNSLTEADNVQTWIENRCADDRIVINVALFKIEKEGSLLFGNRAAQVAAVL